MIFEKETYKSLPHFNFKNPRNLNIFKLLKRIRGPVNDTDSL